MREPFHMPSLLTPSLSSHLKARERCFTQTFPVATIASLPYGQTCPLLVLKHTFLSLLYKITQVVTANHKPTLTCTYGPRTSLEKETTLQEQ